MRAATSDTEARNSCGEIARSPSLSILPSNDAHASRLQPAPIARPKAMSSLSSMAPLPSTSMAAKSEAVCSSVSRRTAARRATPCIGVQVDWVGRQAECVGLQVLMHTSSMNVETSA